MSDRPRLLKLFKAWQRVSKQGNPYQSGWWGDVEIVGFVKEIQHPKNPDETVLEWTYFGQERDPARRPGAAQEREARPLAAEGRDPLPLRPGPHRQRVSAIVDEMFGGRDRDMGNRRPFDDDVSDL